VTQTALCASFVTFARWAEAPLSWKTYPAQLIHPGMQQAGWWAGLNLIEYWSVKQLPGRGTVRPFSEPRESTRRGSFAARQSFSESAICVNPQRRDDRISKHNRVEGPPIESPDGVVQSDRQTFGQF
jgi:hypothetical protein